MARLEDTEKRHNTHMVCAICVCLYRMRMVRKIVPYVYGTKYTYGIEQYYFAHPTAQIFYLIWQETLQAATSTGSGLKGNRLIHLLCKFHTRACHPWRVMQLMLV